MQNEFTLTNQPSPTTNDSDERFASWKFPTLDLLMEHDFSKRPHLAQPTNGLKGLLRRYGFGAHSRFVPDEELEENKNHIIKVFNDFGMPIRAIRAMVGPVITRYEITPAVGVRIAKINSLEDDITLRLAPSGVRIIPPMAGKDTIDIEIPNKNPWMVSLSDVLKSGKFQKATMELPIALGKTTANEVFMVDLAKTPHLLVASATGQGKSTTLHAIIASLLYKKRPDELKIVLVDPKKSEFTVYSPIVQHFLAALEEDAEKPILTETQQTLKTLKGLCVLMDERYEQLKAAKVRSIKEYKEKFLNHQLTPEEGYENMPYIVVVIDEFGDLVLTAGDEAVRSITRVAEWGHQVGVHMVIATQRPSLSIITGRIKANFPGRIAFRVAGMVDSLTILDRPDAQQLTGRGDMLYEDSVEFVRVQGAFVDSAEVGRVCRFIADQPAPAHPFFIPNPLAEPSEVGDEGC